MTTAGLLEVLRDARELIAFSVDWCSRDYALDENYHRVPVGSATAVRFNLIGAVMRCSRDSGGSGALSGELSGKLTAAARETLQAVRPELYTKVAGGLSHPETLALLDAAILSLRDSGVVEVAPRVEAEEMALAG